MLLVDDNFFFQLFSLVSARWSFDCAFKLFCIQFVTNVYVFRYRMYEINFHTVYLFLITVVLTALASYVNHQKFNLFCRFLNNS